MKKIISLLICLAMLSGVAFSAAAAYGSQTNNFALAQTLAEDLKQLNLFMGVSETDFDLERAPTRAEALVMLIRVLGAEKEALNGNWSHPFTDVPMWADKYVGYGYQKGLSNGVSATTFGTGRANAAMYITFVLRALGYTEKEDGFTWDKPFDFANTVGILPAQVNTSNFLRADVVLVSYAALNVKVKGQNKTLAEKLISAGVFTRSTFNVYYDANALASSGSDSSGTNTDSGSTNVNDGAMNAEEIYAKCSPAVFYIELYDARGEATASGSGFFISSDGVAVTNYHVIDGASSAKITLSTNGKTYNVKGVLSYSEEEDWAVIKIDGTNFPYVEIGSASSIVGGGEIFAIGSPLGLQNTISQGIISNVERIIDGAAYIQITAPISPGSSGGALINKYGKVIGITTGSIEAGQSINLAVPASKIRDYKGASPKSFASLFGNNKPMSPSTPSGGSSSGARVTASDAFELLYKIATEQSNFDYGDYIGWQGVNEDEEIAIVYSIEYDLVFIDYIFTSENGVEYNAFISFEPSENYDVHSFTLKVNGDEKFKSTGLIVRSKMDSEYIIPLDSAQSIKGYFDEAALEELETMVQSTTAWLALAMLDDVMGMMTNGAWGVKDLGYINLYK